MYMYTPPEVETIRNHLELLRREHNEGKILQKPFTLNETMALMYRRWSYNQGHLTEWPGQLLVAPDDEGRDAG